jgi:hypothetical protein
MAEVEYISIEGRPRNEVVKLEWPLIVDGKEWREITVRRMTSAELNKYIDGGFAGAPPNIVAPAEVLDALDAEDGIAITEVANRFMPRRLQPPTASSAGQDSPTGGTTASSSPSSPE